MNDKRAMIDELISGNTSEDNYRLIDALIAQERYRYEQLRRSTVDKVIHDRMCELINQLAEQAVEKLLKDVIEQLQMRPVVYITNLISDQGNVWEEILCLLHHEHFYYDHDFLFEINMVAANSTEAYSDTDFSDVGQSQRELANEIFDVIEGEVSRLSDAEVKLITGVYDYDVANEWLFSAEEYDFEMKNHFIEDHIYTELISKAQSVRRQNLLDNINPYLRESFVHQMF